MYRFVCRVRVYRAYSFCTALGSRQEPVPGPPSLRRVLGGWGEGGGVCSRILRKSPPPPPVLAYPKFLSCKATASRPKSSDLGA